MTSIAVLTSTESGANSLTDINTNFSALNSGKIETSVISTDGTFASNSDAKLPSEKAIKTYITNSGGGITVYTSNTTTLSLTTTAGQRVVVWAKGYSSSSQAGSLGYVYLNYNGVEKDRVYATSSGPKVFSLMYTETPGAGTYNITITSDITSLDGLYYPKIIAQVIG